MSAHPQEANSAKRCLTTKRKKKEEKHGMLYRLQEAAGGNNNVLQRDLRGLLECAARNFRTIQRVL